MLINNALKIPCTLQMLLGFISSEAAVKAEVTLAVNIAMAISPNMIQMMEKSRPTIDLGDLSP